MLPQPLRRTVRFSLPEDLFKYHAQNRSEGAHPNRPPVQSSAYCIPLKQAVSHIHMRIMKATWFHLCSCLSGRNSFGRFAGPADRAMVFSLCTSPVQMLCSANLCRAFSLHCNFSLIQKQSLHKYILYGIILTDKYMFVNFSAGRQSTREKNAAGPALQDGIPHKWNISSETAKTSSADTSKTCESASCQHANLTPEKPFFFACCTRMFLYSNQKAGQ